MTKGKILKGKTAESVPTTAIAYIRVSTQMQVDEGHSLENQKVDIEKYCEYQNYDLKKVFRDEGISGSEMDKRDGLKEAIKYCKNNKISYLIVWKLSRLSRSMLDIVNILHDLEKNGIALYILKDNIDTRSAMGKTFIYLSGIFAEIELENMKVQIKGGMRQLARQGGFNGGPAPLGYDIVNKKLVINKEESKIVKYIFEEYLNENGYLTIAKNLNDKGIKTKAGSDYSANGIRFILRNKTYNGWMQWKDSEIQTILVEGEQEAIVDRETFDKVQERIASNPRTHLRNWTTSHLLSGIVKCEACSSSMSNSQKSSKGRIYKYYGCNNYANKKICGPNLIRKIETEDRFKREFKEIINEKEIREKVVERILEEQLRLTQSDATIELQKDELKLLKGKQNNLINTLSQNFSEESTNVIVDSMNSISEEIKHIEEGLEIELKKQHERERNKLNKRDIAEILNNFDSFMSVIDELDARQLALSMIERVETKDKVINKIETRYNQVYEVS